MNVLLRDKARSSDQFVIEMKVSNMSGREVFRSYFGNFQLTPGHPTLLSHELNESVLGELFLEDHIQGASAKRYATDCLPEGSYQFTFQAFAKPYPLRHIALSRPFTFTAFLQSTLTVPYLIYPYDDEAFCNKGDQPNLKTMIPFQWEASNITGSPLTYHLEVVELQGKQNPKNAFSEGATRVLDLPELHTSFYACPISSGKFQDSTTYAWRVKVKSSTSEEKLSDVRTFIFCGEKPVEIDTYKVIGVDDRKFDKNLLRLEADTATQTTNDDKTLNGQFLWKDLSGKNEYCGISVEIRKYGQEKWTPYLVGIDETSYEFTNLSYNVTYEVRGQYLKCDCKEAGQPCDTLYAPYSEIKQVRMPSPADTMDCSSGMGTLSECDETAKYPALKVGDTFDANGTTVTIDSIAYPGAPSDSSRISGAGHLSFPILKNIQLKMKFEDITVNCAKQLKKGRVVSVYDLRTCAMLNLEELTGNKNNGGGNNPTADPTVDDSWDGNPSSLSGKNPGDLVCKDGEVTMVGPDKKAVKVGKIVDLPSLNLGLENSSMTHYIRFHNTDEKTQAFDDRRDEIFYCQLISPGDYVPFDGNTDYIIPWVANNPGRVKKIMADESSINSQAEKIDSVKFIIQKDGGKYIQLNHTYDESKKEYMIDVPGISDVAHTTEIYAVGKIGEGSSYKKYGKLMVANYKERNYNLEIVSLTQSLKNSSLNDSYRKAAEESLNAIYGRVGVTFKVQLSEFQDPELEEILKDGVAIGADEQSHWLAETSDMRAIRKAYRKKVGKKDNTAYLFVAQEPEESNYKNVEGDMPVGQAVGYIFMKNTNLNKFGHLVAHEIGHGVFKFQHPFAYKRIKENEKYNRKTNNLMDYNGGEYLGHYQWRAMQDSVGFVWSALQDDEDGMSTLKQYEFVEALHYANNNANKKVMVIGQNIVPVQDYSKTAYLSNYADAKTEELKIISKTESFSYLGKNFEYSVRYENPKTEGKVFNSTFLVSSEEKNIKTKTDGLLVYYEYTFTELEAEPSIPLVNFQKVTKDPCVAIVTVGKADQPYFEEYLYSNHALTLTVSEIAQARERIAQMTDQAEKEQAYLDLQWVVPYHSQRDNVARDTVYIKLSEEYNAHGDLTEKIYQDRDAVRRTTYVYNEKWELQSSTTSKVSSRYITLDGKKNYSTAQFWFWTKATNKFNEVSKDQMRNTFTTSDFFNDEFYTETECLAGNTNQCKKVHLTTKFYGGKIRDIMCNLTSVSMGLDYLGLQKPCSNCHSSCASMAQLEDYLECERLAFNYGDRINSEVWTDLLEKFGVEGKSVTIKDLHSVQKNSDLSSAQKQTEINARKAALKEKINGELKKGNAVVMSLFPTGKGHIVRVVAVTDDGIVFDDPYGKMFPSGFAERERGGSGYDKVNGRNIPTDTPDKAERGKHVLYTWTDLTNCTMKFYYTIKLSE